MKKNPRTTKRWKFLNDSEYKDELNAKDREFLDAFDVAYFEENASCRDALDRCPVPLEESVLDGALQLYRGRDEYRSLSVEDIKLYLGTLSSSLSLRDIAKASGVPKTTLIRKFRLVRKLLSEVDQSTLVDGD